MTAELELPVETTNRNEGGTTPGGRRVRGRVRGVGQRAAAAAGAASRGGRERWRVRRVGPRASAAVEAAYVDIAWGYRAMLVLFIQALFFSRCECQGFLLRSSASPSLAKKRDCMYSAPSLL